MGMRGRDVLCGMLYVLCTKEPWNFGTLEQWNIGEIGYL
jgi:hypothetical protein